MPQTQARVSVSCAKCSKCWLFLPLRELNLRTIIMLIATVRVLRTKSHGYDNPLPYGKKRSAFNNPLPSPVKIDSQYQPRNKVVGHLMSRLYLCTRYNSATEYLVSLPETCGRLSFRIELNRANLASQAINDDD